MPTANPTLQVSYFQREAAISDSSAMTIRGTAIKSLVLGVLLSVTAAISWSQVFPNGLTPEANGSIVVNQTSMLVAILAGLGGGLVTSLIICFFPKTAPFLAPVYAVCEGALLGAISGLYSVKAYPGIVPQAILMTIGTLAVMLICWATGIIRMSDKLRSGIIAATGTVCLVYLVAFVLSFFGVNLSFLYGNGPISIGISIVVVIIAAANLLLDFDTIETGARMRAPKYMEWYAAFGLMVTLVWLYLEILRLLAKVAGNRDR